MYEEKCTHFCKKIRNVRNILSNWQQIYAINHELWGKGRINILDVDSVSCEEQAQTTIVYILAIERYTQDDVVDNNNNGGEIW